MKKNGQRRYKYLVLGRDRSYFVQKHSDFTKRFSETDIISMLGFLIDNIFVFGGHVFQQTVGIPMGTNCAPLHDDLFLYSYEADFIHGLLKKNEKKLARSFNFTFRYIDDVLSLNNYIPSRACGSYQDFLDRGLLLTRTLLKQGFQLFMLKSSLRRCYGHHHDLLNHYVITVSQMITDMFHLL